MEIRQEAEIPPKQAKRMNFPELLTLKAGECAVYGLEEYGRVSRAARFITRQYGRKYTIRSFPEQKECKVWLRIITKKE